LQTAAAKPTQPKTTDSKPKQTKTAAKPMQAKTVQGKPLQPQRSAGAHRAR
jgi:hypothetical protein